MRKIHWFPLFCCLVIPLSVGALGGMWTAESVGTWYAGLHKPEFNPPNSLFGPVWTVLYLLMGVSSYLIWEERKKKHDFFWAMLVYALQLLLNLLWSFLFFHQKQIGMALVEIVLLLLAILTNAFVFFRIRPLAGLLYIPYFLWVIFASYLTYSIYILN